MRPSLALLVLLCIPPTISAVRQSGPGDAAGTRALEDYRREGREAYARKDYPAAIRAFRSALDLAPTHPRVLANLAAVLALAGNLESSLQILNRLADESVEYDVAGDENMKALRALDGYDALVARMRVISSRTIATSVTAFSLSELDLLTEGIACDPVSEAFFVSSVHKRKIVRIDRNGTTRDFIAPAQDGLLGAKGLRVDPVRRWLWVASMALPQVEGFGTDLKGRSGLYAFDLDTGSLRRKLLMGSPDDPHGFDDLAIAHDGRIFVSDGASGGIWSVAPEATTLDAFLPAGTFLNPNGLALSNDGSRLYVSDYPRDSLSVVDVANRAIRQVAHGRDVSLYSIDGLVAHGDSLIAIQNGLTPHRVIQLFLDRDGATVTGSRILEMNNPDWNEPTLGVMVGTSFYYVASSQWGRFDESTGAPDRTRLQPSLILRAIVPPRPVAR